MQLLNRLIKNTAWSLLWLVFFWAFLVSGFPNEAARGWLADRIGKGLNAAVGIEKLDITWNLGVKLKGISINRGQGGSAQTDEGFSIKLDSLDIRPRLFSLIRLKPEIDFNGSTPTGGPFSGSYNPDNISISFKDISFKDISISTLPVPSAASMSGSGNLKFVKGKGTIEVEVDGIPGGRQKLKTPGGEAPGLDGKLKVMVSLPKL